MFNRNSLKLGLTGAILFIIMGSFTACSDNSPTEPTGPQHAETAGECWIVNGQWICDNG